jgi:hypothetical protein
MVKLTKQEAKLARSFNEKVGRYTNTIDGFAELRLQIEGPGQIDAVHVPSLARMHPSRLRLHENTYYVDWTGMTQLNKVCAYRANIVEWPAQASLIPNLHHLDLTFCHTLNMAACCTWSSLQTLKLNTCNNIEEIPAEISNLTNLQELDLLFMNNLQRIASLRGCTNLKHLNLFHCESLTGKVVLPLGIEKLRINTCPLNYGDVFASICACTNLTTLQLIWMRFDDQLPDCLYNLVKLKNIHISDCLLKGEISPRFADMTKLEDLNLSRNQLTGTVPDDVAKMPSLKKLDVSTNWGLGGQIIRAGKHIYASDTNIKVVT